MYILESKFIVNKEVGELNTNQISQLKKDFSFFPQYSNNENNEHRFSGANQGIVISSIENAIVYFYQGESEEIDYDKIFTCINKVRKLVDNEERDHIGIALQGISNFEGNSMEESLKRLPQYKVDESIVGVGVRVLCTDDHFNGEVKIEPFINDTEKVYSFGNTLSIGKVIVSKDMFEIQNKKLIEIAEKLRDVSFDMSGIE